MQEEVRSILYIYTKAKMEEVGISSMERLGLDLIQTRLISVGQEQLLKE
jgi:hypothetical protein